jgi:hypothetical protein
MDVDHAVFPRTSSHRDTSPPGIDDVRMRSPPPNLHIAASLLTDGTPSAATPPIPSAPSAAFVQSIKIPPKPVINPFLHVRKTSRPHPVPISTIQGSSIAPDDPVVRQVPTVPIPRLSASTQHSYAFPISLSAGSVSDRDPSTRELFSRPGLVNSIRDSPHTYTAVVKSLSRLFTPNHIHPIIDRLPYGVPFHHPSSAAAFPPSVVIPAADGPPSLSMEVDPSPGPTDLQPLPCALPILFFMHRLN